MTIVTHITPKISPRDEAINEALAMLEEAQASAEPVTTYQIARRTVEVIEQHLKKAWANAHCGSGLHEKVCKEILEFADNAHDEDCYEVSDYGDKVILHVELGVQHVWTTAA